MSMLTGLLWWIVLGALLGWLASWLFGRGARQALPAPVERVVEKPVDNPAHVSRIEELEKEVAEIGALRARVCELEAAPPGVVEKIVEQPVERTVADTAAPTERAQQIAQWRERHAEAERQLGVQRRRASELEGQVLRLQPPAIDPEAARSAGFTLNGPGDLTVIAGIGPDIAALLNGAGVGTLHELGQSAPARLRAILADASPSYRTVNPDTWPEQAVLAARNHWHALKSLQEALVAGVRVDRERERNEMAIEMRSLKRQLADCETEIARLSAAPVLDGDAARAAGFELKHSDDLEIIEGIGPGIAEVLGGAGITTFHALSRLTPAEIKSTLARGGPNFSLVNPQTWSDQALLAAHNRWASLATMQAALEAGRRK